MRHRSVVFLSSCHCVDLDFFLQCPSPPAPTHVSPDKNEQGDIVVSLEFEKAPMTVGNCVGLAEGTLDVTKGNLSITPHVSTASGPTSWSGGRPSATEPEDRGTASPTVVPELKHDVQAFFLWQMQAPNTMAASFSSRSRQLRARRNKTLGLSAKFVRAGRVKQISRETASKRSTIQRFGRRPKPSTVRRSLGPVPQRGLPTLNASTSRSAMPTGALRQKWPDRNPTRSSSKSQPQGFWSPPSPGSKVSVIYKGMLLDGTVFDQFGALGGPVQLHRGQRRSDRGWGPRGDTMQKGEKRLVIIPPELAYGHRASSVYPAQLLPRLRNRACLRGAI